MASQDRVIAFQVSFVPVRPRFASTKQIYFANLKAMQCGSLGTSDVRLHGSNNVKLKLGNA